VWFHITHDFFLQTSVDDQFHPSRRTLDYLCCSDSICSLPDAILLHLIHRLCIHFSEKVFASEASYPLVRQMIVTVTVVSGREMVSFCLCSTLFCVFVCPGNQWFCSLLGNSKGYNDNVNVGRTFDSPRQLIADSISEFCKTFCILRMKLLP
jgi:hypothetical protein